MATTANGWTDQPRIRRNDYSGVRVPLLGQWQPTLPVSVVIPSYNNQPQLDITLASLAAQSYPPRLLQVVVVDDSSSPPLRLPDIAPEHTLLIRSGPDGWGAAHAMHTGIQAAGGEVIHRLDSDMLVCREHIEACMRWHHVADYLLVIGYKRFVAVDCDDMSPTRVRVAVARDAAETLVDIEQSTPSWIERVIDKTDGLRTAVGDTFRVGTGQTMSFSRRLYDACGGIDTALIRGQDTEFTYRATQAGAVVIPEPEARAIHLGPTELMKRNAEGKRLREPYVGNRVPLWRDRSEPGRQWLVPYVDVVMDANAASFEEARATVARTLANTAAEVRITVLGPWARLVDDRRAPLDDELLDARLIHESFVHDARVRLVEEVPPTSSPAPFRLRVPVGWIPREGALRKLLKTVEREAHGLLILGLPGGLHVRLERTSALARALHLCKDGEKLDEVVDEIFGTGWIDNATWAFAHITDDGADADTHPGPADHSARTDSTPSPPTATGGPPPASTVRRHQRRLAATATRWRRRLARLRRSTST